MHLADSAHSTFALCVVVYYIYYSFYSRENEEFGAIQEPVFWVFHRAAAGRRLFRVSGVCFTGK